MREHVKEKQEKEKKKAYFRMFLRQYSDILKVGNNLYIFCDNSTLLRQCCLSQKP